MTNEKGPGGTGSEGTHMDQSKTIGPAEQAPVALSTLAERINEEHHQVEAALTNGLEHAKGAGELLMQAKAQCQHGEWSGWLAENFEGSERTAQAYMQIAEHWPQLEAAKAQRVAFLTYGEALKLLTAPKQVRKPEQRPPAKRFLDAPLPVRQQHCREWWDILVSHALVLDAAGWASQEVAEALAPCRDCHHHEVLRDNRRRRRS